MMATGGSTNLTLHLISMAAAAGIKPGDVITSIGGMATTNPAWPSWRQKYGSQEGAQLPLGVMRGDTHITINAVNKLAVLLNRKIEGDSSASEKAKRIRDGILNGTTGAPADTRRP